MYLNIYSGNIQWNVVHELIDNLMDGLIEIKILIYIGKMVDLIDLRL